MASLREEIESRRTFAIISHPDAGKTTLTEKLLLYGGAIQTAGSVKGKQSAKHAVSDWMDIEKQRGPLPRLFCSSTIRASASTFWTRPATRTSVRIPTAP